MQQVYTSDGRGKKFTHNFEKEMILEVYMLGRTRRLEETIVMDPTKSGCIITCMVIC
jgi:hypothetical protein